jgi:hypothetical protein
MRYEKQVESSTTVNRARIYNMILSIWDDLPDRFKAQQLYDLAAIPKSHVPQRRILVASVLANDFKCIQVCNSGNNNRYWKKP